MSNEERERWNRRYRERTGGAREPSPYLVALGGILPRSGRALDVGGGDGRNGLWLAARGLDVTIADISEAGLDLAAARADAAGVAITTVLADLESAPLPDGPWDVILDFNFLIRSLIPRIVEALAPGGYFIWLHPTRSNLERHTSPGARFLLDDGESVRMIADLAESNLQIMEYHEGWQESGRHESRLVVRRLA